MYKTTFLIFVMTLALSGCGSTNIPILGPTAVAPMSDTPTATLTATPSAATYTPLPTETSTPTPTATNVPIPTAISISGQEVLFSDDFSNPLSGWDLYPDWGQRCPYRAKYLNDEMVLNVGNGDKCSLARPHLKFDNFILEVVARWSGGAIGGEYGVQFRYQDEDNYYGFYLRNDGRYEIGKRANGKWITLVEIFSDAIDRTGAPNLIRIEANESTLTFFINGHFINSIHDVDHRIGDIVFFAYAPAGAQFFEASFNNLVITKYP